MVSKNEEQPDIVLPPIYVLSGGVGTSGEQLVQTILAQFPNNRVPVIVIGSVREIEQIEEAVNRATGSGGMIVHTMVDAHLRQALNGMTGQQGIFAVDLVGTILDRLTDVLGVEPLGQPGLYRKLHRDYFERVEAIEYTMAHDDGKDPEGWSKAEIVLVGISRTGKTPLSLYLSVLGWKVANIPIVPGIPVSPELSQLDRRRVIGLTIEPGQLLIHRKQRQSRLGAPGRSSYADPAAVFDEVQTAARQIQEAGFSLIDVTDKTIETSADEVLRLISHRVR